MSTLSGPARSSLLGAVLLASCTAPPPTRSQFDTRSIAPLAESSSAGTLVAGVRGFPRDIRYFVNGVQIEPETEIEWWKDARLVLSLKPGVYRVEATYRARAFAAVKTSFRIETTTPVEVQAGQTTYILAAIEKDWRGMPVEPKSAFRVVGADEFEGRAAAAPAPAAAEVASAPPEPTPVTDPPDEVLVIRGSRDGPSEVSHVPMGEATESAPTSIVIHGQEIMPAEIEAAAPATASIETAAASTPSASTETAVASTLDASTETAVASTLDASTETAAATDAAGGAAVAATAVVGLPSAAEPEHQDLTEGATSARPTVPVVLQSKPEGARVFLDERDVGKTPLRLQLDPTTDHVLRFERDGCGDHVRFLSAAGWEKGRSSAVTVQLECP